mmetsp:Transcript_5021/g.14306  ORF Transcript_5021/g.14306 Transcript_5021/m.14306 type:complete len:204 (+) Transcript_5021:1404-2015(+)
MATAAAGRRGRRLRSRDPQPRYGLRAPRCVPPPPLQPAWRGSCAGGCLETRRSSRTGATALPSKPARAQRCTRGAPRCWHPGPHWQECPAARRLSRQLRPRSKAHRRRVRTFWNEGERPPRATHPWRAPRQPRSRSERSAGPTAPMRVPGTGPTSFSAPCVISSSFAAPAQASPLLSDFRRGQRRLPRCGSGPAYRSIGQARA